MRVLIIGVGFLGTKLMSKFSNHFEVYGTSFHNRKELFQLDICDKENMNSLFSKINPDIVIHTAAFSDVDKCEEDKEFARKINIEGIKNVINACRNFNSKLMFISTDFVFDGKKGDYTEEDLSMPLNYYGETKLEGERLIINSGVKYIIIRTAVLYGYNDKEDGSNFFKWVYESLKNGKKINVFTDQINSPTLIDDIAEVLIVLINKDKEGRFNVVGSETISRFDFAVKIADFFWFDKKLIKPIKSNQFKQKALRPRNVSLDISKIKRLGIKMNGVNSGLMVIKEVI